jgi:hypothetical protein
MIAARPQRPPLVYSMGRPDANHNFGRGREGQRAGKNQSDGQSLKKHNMHSVLSAKLPGNSAAGALPSSSRSEGVIENQENHRADNRDQEAVEVESPYARRSKDVEQPATNKSADNAQ